MPRVASPTVPEPASGVQRARPTAGSVPGADCPARRDHGRDL